MGKWEVILLLGSNLGNRNSHLEKGIGHIANLIGKIVQTSNIYESAPWGFQAENSFLNQAIKVKTDMGPRSILHTIWKIEQTSGRERSADGYASRTLDIDILTWESKIFWTQKLQVPHIQLQNRKFALLPLTELVGDQVHPVLSKTYDSLLKSCPDQTWVKSIAQSHA
ncbi:MAG: 2-amino-4-hydroxy-6-hydroxymethyldihydropteridine diphosphokinase [Granulosicoccus sp.]|jgi:2-amino-4-hydroxy-6-hydroxymethyldihydropteridine diphosphokinase